MNRRMPLLPAVLMVCLTATVFTIALFTLVGSGLRFVELARMENGPTTDGQVIGWKDGVKKSTAYRIQYTFTVDGQQYTSEWQSVSQEEWNRTRTNPTLTVRHAADNPNLNIPDDRLGTDQTFLILVLVTGFVMLLGSGFMMVLAGLALRKAVRDLLPEPAIDHPTAANSL